MDSRLRQAFEEFFASTSGIVGHEFNYQAQLAHVLKKNFPSLRIVREYSNKAVFKGSVDIAAVNSLTGGLVYVFEIKGGAYGSRNALKDTFSDAGICKDYAKLKTRKSHAAECWMVAVDALELGRGIGPQKLNQVLIECENNNLGLAYYAFGDTQCTLLSPSLGENKVPVIPEKGSALPFSCLAPYLHEQVLGDASLLGSYVGKEADIVGNIYSQLLNIGASPKQIALDAYYGFAPRNGQALQRPDISIFEPDIEGHFNLYPNGSTNLSYDKQKLESLRCLIEVKGGASLLIYLKDIQKLCDWRGKINAEAAMKSIELKDIEYLFIVVDQRKNGLSSLQQEELFSCADMNKITVKYLNAQAPDFN